MSLERENGTCNTPEAPQGRGQSSTQTILDFSVLPAAKTLWATQWEWEGVERRPVPALLHPGLPDVLGELLGALR